MGNGPRLMVYFPGVNDALADVHRLSFVSSNILNPWARHHTAIVISRRRGIPAGYTIADISRDYAEAIAAFIDQYQPATGKAHIAGVSMGGFCALQFAHDYPELTASVGIHSAAHRPHHQTVAAAAEWQRLALDGRWGELYRALNNVTFSGIYRVGFNLLDMLLSPWVHHPPEHPQDFIHSIEACRAFDLGDSLHTINLPAQMIAGDRDALFPVDLLRECAAGLPHCKLELIAGGGHGVIVDHKRQFDNAFNAFLLSA